MTHPIHATQPSQEIIILALRIDKLRDCGWKHVDFQARALFFQAGRKVTAVAMHQRGYPGLVGAPQSHFGWIFSQLSIPYGLLDEVDCGGECADESWDVGAVECPDVLEAQAGFDPSSRVNHEFHVEA
jgi:hypothetical protein